MPPHPFLALLPAAAAFGDPRYFTDRRVPSNVPGVDLKVPDFDVLFEQLREVSPLADQAFAEAAPGGLPALRGGGERHRWKTVAANPARPLSRIEKIDDFQGKATPLLRFRASLTGPKKQRGYCFSDLISDLELRKQWDATLAVVQEDYCSADLADVAGYLRPDQGTPARFGIGYVKTKQSVVSPREQLTLCGLQLFPSGASVLWGVELEEDQDHLFPTESQPKRVQRSTSHLFCNTIVPRGEGDGFDVEYLVQIEVGGLPGWLTGPAVVDTIKKLFRFADGYFADGLKEGGGDGALARRLAALPDEEAGGAGPGEEPRELSSAAVADAISDGVLDRRQALLMPP